MGILSYHCNHDSCPSPVFIIFSLYWKAICFYYWKRQKLLLPGPNFSTISHFIPEIPPSLPFCLITTSVPILFKVLLHSFMFQEIRLLKSLLPSRKEIAPTSLVLGLPCHNWLEKKPNKKTQPTNQTNKQKTKPKQAEKLTVPKISLSKWRKKPLLCEQRVLTVLCSNKLFIF